MEFLTPGEAWRVVRGGTQLNEWVFDGVSNPHINSAEQA